MSYLRFLLWPFAILYHVGTGLRNWLYDINIFKQTSFRLPLIGIGNLSTGGTGKTPMAIEIAEMLQKAGLENIAILSRGYGRQSTGFFEVLVPDPPLYGDEPSEISLNLPWSKVFVCENRVKGVEEILRIYPATEVIILDDCFQHRAIECGIYIMLNNYAKPFYSDWILPMGSLRESKEGRQRADIIVNTKTPNDIVDKDKMTQNKIRRRIQPQFGQNIYFTGLQYRPLRSADNKQEITYESLNSKNILLITSIADPSPMLSFLSPLALTIKHLKYKDHHNFSDKNIDHIRKEFENLEGSDTIIVTTGKDLVKLKQPESWPMLHDLPIYFLPQKIHWQPTEKDNFEAQIVSYVSAHHPGIARPEEQNKADA